MTTVSLTDVASYLPGEPVPAEFYTDFPGAEDKLRNHPMFKVPPLRHHVARDAAQVLQAVLGVLDGVVQQPRHEGGRVHAQLGE
ncbi:hypothetical protein ACN6LA_001396, partial [Streptomyces sp. SAS_269]